MRSPWSTGVHGDSPTAATPAICRITRPFDSRAAPALDTAARPWALSSSMGVVRVARDAGAEPNRSGLLGIEPDAAA